MAEYIVKYGWIKEFITKFREIERFFVVELYALEVFKHGNGKAVARF